MAGFLKAIGAIRKFTAGQGVVNPRAFDARKIATEGVQEFRQMPRDQVLRARGVPVHAAQDFGVDVSGALDLERGGGERLFPFDLAVLESEVSIEKMSARSQHPRHLGQKSRERRITVGRLDIDHRVEGVGFKRQIFGVALHEDQPVNVVPLFAETDSGGIQVQGSVTLRLKRAREVAGATAVPATDFQNIFPPQPHLRGDVMIKLDAGAIGFVFGLQRDAHGRRLFKSVVEE